MNHLRTPLDVPMALFFLSALGGLWASYDRSLSWPMLTTIALGVICYYTVVGVVTSDSQASLVALCGLVSGLVVAVCFVTQYDHVAHQARRTLVNQLKELTSLFSCIHLSLPHPNSVATFLEGWLVVAVAMSLQARRLRIRAVTGISAAVLGLAILLSESHGAWLSLALCVPLWWATRSSPNLIVAAACGTALVLGAAGYVVLSPGASVERIATAGRTLVPLFDRPDRLGVYRGSWHLIQDFPFTGIGLGDTFAAMYSRYVLLIRDPFLSYSHNLFLQIWLNHGLLGILSFLWLIVTFLAFVWQIRRQTTGGALFQGAWLGVAVTLLHGLTDARQYVDGWTFLPFFALLGLAVAMGRSSTSEHAKAGSLAWKSGGVIAAALLGIAMAVIWPPVAALAHGNAGALSQARAELNSELTDGEKEALLEEAAEHYRHAVALDPGNRTPHQRLGMLAMDAQSFGEAVAHLEAAYETDPGNTTTRKALGLAYTWTGRLYQTEQFLADVPDIVEELNVWGWWWGTQGEYEWAANAYEVSLLLNPDQPSIREALTAAPAD